MLACYRVVARLNQLHLVTVVWSMHNMQSID